MLQIGQLVEGKYRILSKVGQGGMSVVYMAINERANKTWAIKEVRKDTSQRAAVANNGIITETNMLRQLSHPNMPSIVDVIEDQDSFLIVMDFIEGKTLKHYVRESGAQKQEDVVKWAKQLCGVLGYLHSQDPPIIYRDMKPSNIMLKPNGDVVLFDFGAARKYREESELDDTVCLGTKGYAAPEQYGGHGQTDARTDIYCLGATMYHLITGHNPAEPPYEIYPIRHWNPSLSAGLEAVIEKCTQNNPEDRYQDCSELMYALDHYWESDETYRKMQVHNLHKFLIPAALTLVFGVASVSMLAMHGYAKSNNYDTYIQMAKDKSDHEDQIDSLKRALELDPARSEAYDYLLNSIYLSDFRLTAEEKTELEGIIYASSGGSDYMSRFRAGNKSGYAAFVYDLGIAYYFRYYLNEDDEKSEINWVAASRSFNRLIEDNYVADLPKPNEQFRSKVLYSIIKNHSVLTQPDPTGDISYYGYAQYWQDLYALTFGRNIVEEDTAQIAVLIYRSMISEIHTHATDFKRGGVKASELYESMDMISSRIDTDFAGATDDPDLERSLVILKENIPKARDSVDSAYGRGGDRK